MESKNSAKAVLFNYDSVLLIKKRRSDGQEIYTLPGGTQEAGEALESTVVREVFEEIGAKIRVCHLSNVFEHTRPGLSNPNNQKHKIEFAFECEFELPYQPKLGPHPDPNQITTEWVPLAHLNYISLDPMGLAKILPNIYRKQEGHYYNLVSAPS